MLFRSKTSWACQIAEWGLQKQLTNHRMIPVLLEADLEKNSSLVETLSGLLSSLTQQTDSLPPELVEKLLRRQRLLVIVDHLSEMGSATREAISPALPDFAPKALVVTSRLEETDRLGNLPHTTLRPLQIQPGLLWPFMKEIGRAHV